MRHGCRAGGVGGQLLNGKKDTFGLAASRVQQAVPSSVEVVEVDSIGGDFGAVIATIADGLKARLCWVDQASGQTACA